MEAIVRTAAIYLLLLLVFRLYGRPTPPRMTSFDLLLLVIVGGVIQQALLGNDHSLTNAALVLLTLASLHAAATALKRRRGNTAGHGRAEDQPGKPTAPKW